MHQLRATQLVPLTLAEAWTFFSDPRNLAVITPPAMGFEVRSPLPPAMYPGLMVEYRVRPLPGIPMKWVTEITHVEDRAYFVDEQRAGPYRIWHHEHHFKIVLGGVEVRDIVSYELPFGPLGALVERFVVRQRLAHIFDFRRAVLEDRFGPMPQPTVTTDGQKAGA